MRNATVLCLVLSAVALGCGDDDDLELPANSSDRDAATDVQGDGKCEAATCPEPDMGVACCAPNGACGSDPSGLGLVCVANAGEGNVCVLDDCPLPSVGNACCTPFGTCGLDPFESGVFCFANPPFVEGPPPDAGSCDPSECATPEIGNACCTVSGACGADPFDIGLCFPIPPEEDAGPPPVVSFEPPDDPAVDGQCPSYIDEFGFPVWGCCSGFSVCGAFVEGTCFLPEGTLVPVGDQIDDDAGVFLGSLLCDPPATPIVD